MNLATTIALLSSHSINVGAFSAVSRTKEQGLPSFPNNQISLPWQRISSTSYYGGLLQTALASTAAKDSSGANAQKSTGERNVSGGARYNVLYQKVIRAPSNSASSTSSLSQTFLLDLVIFLQNMFELPDGLPMPYEITVPDNDDEEDRNSDNRAVLIIDSSLSNDPYEACLEVEVVGIFPDISDDNANGADQKMQIGPTMAMVAVKKRKAPINGNSVTGGLFAASEKRIIQSLDRGLQDLEEGRVTIPSSLRDNELLNDFDKLDDDGNDDEVDAAIKRIGYKNSIDAATSSKSVSKRHEKKKNQQPSPITIERDGMGNVVIDSISKPMTPPTKNNEKATEQKKKIENKNAENKSDERAINGQPLQTAPAPVTQMKKGTALPKSQDNEDYAIQMARKRAEVLMTTARVGSITSSTEGTIAISGGEGDFAIMAAKRAADSKKRIKKSAEKVSAGLIKGEEKNTVNPLPSEVNGKQSAVATNAQKAKENDPSKDEVLMKLQNVANSSKRKSWSTTISKAPKKGEPNTLNDDGGASSANRESTTISKGKRVNIIASSPPLSSEPSTANVEPTHKGAQSAITATSSTETDTPGIQKTDKEIQDDIMKIANENKQIQQDLLKAATDMMPVENEGEEGLSPEELLAQVLKFGDEKEKEESPGFGFVEGAFGKAKDLLKAEERAETKFKELEDNPLKYMKYEGSDSREELKRKAEEEELKRIFATGQSEAVERITNPNTRSSNLAKTSITEEDIDALIANDQTVPRNARILDDELAELELRISRSKGEETDGPAKNKVFDVFSGPETYNPNVDPETAVNWPGAKEGTRTDVRLATELSTALKQAKFAASVLSQMREEESEEGVRYFVGEKELSLDRVNLLRTCTDEAVKAGLIEDPQILMIERFRLQMLLDELISQPEERLEEIALNYKDLLLSDNLVELMKERLRAMTERDLEARREGKEDSLKEQHARERAILINLAQIGQGLVREAQALGAELEVSMLEIIRSICEVAMDPSHKTSEDTAMALTDAVRDIRPLLDDAFVAYLKYAIAEEEGKLAREGVLDDPDQNRWLFILKIVQEGVYAELSRGLQRYVDHIFYVLRMNSKSERRELLSKLIEVLPTMDVRPFVKVVNNIVSSLGTTVNGDFADGVILGEMTNKLLQLQRDVSDLLPPERITELSKDADDWAAAQRERLMERQKLTRQRLEGARQTGGVDPDKVIKKPGVEAERFD